MRLGEQLPCILHSGRGGVFAREHSGDLADTFLFCETAYMGLGAGVGIGFINKVLRISFGGNLRQVGDSDYLARLSHLLHNIPHL